MEDKIIATSDHNKANRQRIVFLSCSFHVFDTNPHRCEINLLEMKQIFNASFLTFSIVEPAYKRFFLKTSSIKLLTCWRWGFKIYIYVHNYY